MDKKNQNQGTELADELLENVTGGLLAYTALPSSQLAPIAIKPIIFKPILKIPLRECW